jgi:hypothetical protein
LSRRQQSATSGPLKAADDAFFMAHSRAGWRPGTRFATLLRMAVLQAILAAIGRQLGRLLNTAFSWATVLLFGKVPERRQLYLSAISAGSVLWLVLLIGVAFPSVGTFLMAFVPLPKWIDQATARLIMLAAAALLPMVIGILSLFLLEPADRPEGIYAKLKAVAAGYPYTFGLALTLVLMTIVAPLLKARAVFRRWTTTHIPIVVEPRNYEETVLQMHRVLCEQGLETVRRPATWLLRGPTKLLTVFAGARVERMVANQLAVLRGADVELILHPADLVLSGREKTVTRTHAIITEHLTGTKAYLTWSKEAQEIEDRLHRLYRQVQAGAMTRGHSQTAIQDIRATVVRLPISYEEWEVLFRQRVLLERDILAASLPPDADLTRKLRPDKHSAAGRSSGLGLAAILASGLALTTMAKRWTKKVGANAAERSSTGSSPYRLLRRAILD